MATQDKADLAWVMEQTLAKAAAITKLEVTQEEAGQIIPAADGVSAGV